MGLLGGARLGKGGLVKPGQVRLLVGTNGLGASKFWSNVGIVVGSAGIGGGLDLGELTAERTRTVWLTFSAALGERVTLTTLQSGGIKLVELYGGTLGMAGAALG